MRKQQQQQQQLRRAASAATSHGRSRPAPGSREHAAAAPRGARESGLLRDSLKVTDTHVTAASLMFIVKPYDLVHRLIADLAFWHEKNDKYYPQSVSRRSCTLRAWGLQVQPTTMCTLPHHAPRVSPLRSRARMSPVRSSPRLASRGFHGLLVHRSLKKGLRALRVCMFHINLTLSA